MVNVHRYHQISEVDHRILNPLSDDDVARLGAICGLHAGQRHLDLASGKGEMLCQYARHHGTTGIGVDIFEPYVETARARALELGVEHAVEFVLEDASAYTAEPDSFDVVSCIGATWIGGGLPGTLRLMRPAVRDDGWMLVGEVFWNEEPTPAVRTALAYEAEVVDLAGLLGRVEDAGLDLVEMVIAEHATWDRYSASQWLNVSRWLAGNSDDPEADDIRRTRDAGRRQYLEIERQYVGWGVFVLKPG